MEKFEDKYRREIDVTNTVIRQKKKRLFDGYKSNSVLKEFYSHIGKQINYPTFVPDTEDAKVMWDMNLWRIVINKEKKIGHCATCKTEMEGTQDCSSTIFFCSMTCREFSKIKDKQSRDVYLLC